MARMGIEPRVLDVNGFVISCVLYSAPVQSAISLVL